MLAGRVALTLFALVAARPALSLPLASPGIPEKPSGYVTDAARVMTLNEVKALDERCAQIDSSGKAQIAILIIDSLNGEPIDQAAANVWSKWGGIGKKGVNNGLLLMLSIRDRKSRLSVGSGLERLLPNDTAESILRAMRPQLRAGNYSGALNLALDQLEGRLSKGTETSH